MLPVEFIEHVHCELTTLKQKLVDLEGTEDWARAAASTLTNSDVENWETPKEIGAIKRMIFTLQSILDRDAN